MISSIKESFRKSEPFRRFRELVTDRGKPVNFHISGVHGSLLAFVADLLAEEFAQVLLIVPDKDRAEILRDDCALISLDKKVNLYAHVEHHAVTALDMSGPISSIETLHSLAAGVGGIVVASAEAAASRLPAPSFFRERSLTLTEKGEYPFQELLHKLEEWKFERKDFVEGYGDFAVRGGILDVFPFVGDHPLRIEFWGDTVESIREFEPLSQRSIRELRSSSIVAGLPESADSGGRSSTLFDYLKADTILFVEEEVLCGREIDELFHEGVKEILPWSEILERGSRFPRVLHSTLPAPAPVDVHFGSSPQPAFHGSVKLLLEDLRREKVRSFRQIIACDSEEEATRLRELLEEEVGRRNGDTAEEQRLPELLSEGIHGGFAFPAAALVLYTEHEAFGRLKKRGTRRRPRFRGFSQREVFRLKKGDFVVHVDYGVGKFAGLQTIKVRGNDQEVMKILYDENDALYVNLNFVNSVQKYSSQEGHEPKLTKLGTPQWDRIKARARKRIKDIARGLIRLYAQRKHEPGFAFSTDSHWQKEMEASFMYEDTPDQAKATDAVKEDMQQPVPMDRLICGDVGFGKTEVAVRAAFKAALDGKQTAVLVPTTILAQQHYQTFLDRLERYSVRVASLTRFRTKQEQKKILEELKEGSVDVMIGTHRLLSKDVVFKDLGLLIIDEEHRFGVTAKERLRQLRASVDTLMLTATPIPRTLQFSLMGARDLSIINTPPRNRLPIVTEICEFDLDLIREAILKELHRGGQVYVIHDRIQTMDLIAQQLRVKIPEARFHTAHGQMKGHELEKAMLEFLEHKYDVLICTKIIESGIDIPRVNTIIINRADRFGLAELYQLRGRVGRSNVQAYAYLLTPPVVTLPRVALQRLQSVQEFTELGSGFNLAMRDMEIRGAGNLLGAEQSGFIMEMGFEMYQRVVEEAVQELKDQEFKDMFAPAAEEKAERPPETVLESDLEALIPDVYVESDQERLDIYRRLYRARILDDVHQLGEELRDRFGDPPEEVDLLLGQVEVKTLASQLRIPRVELIGQKLVLFLPPSTDTGFYGTTEEMRGPFQAVMSLLGSTRGIKYQLRQEGPQLKLNITLEGGREPMERLSETFNILSRFVDTTAAKEAAS